MRIRSLIRLALAAAIVPGLAQEASRIAHDAQQAYEAQHFSQAAALYTQAFEQDQTDPNLAYNAACSFALSGDREAAFRFLVRATEAGWTNWEATAKDSDLKSLHADPRWGSELEHIKAREAREQQLWKSPALTTAYHGPLTEDERIAGLSRFWSEVKYNFADPTRLADLDWDGLYLRTLPKARAAVSNEAYAKVLMAFCAELKDSHTNIFAPPPLRERMQARPALRTKLVEGHVVVTGVFDETLKEQGLVPGVEITSVDGQPVKAYAETQLAPYQSASTPQDMETRIYTYAFLSGPLDQAPLIGCLDATGKAFHLHVPRLPSEARRKAMPSPPSFSFRMLTGGIGLVTLNSFEDSSAADRFMETFPAIAKAKGLILDVRDNDGGNSGVGYRILTTLADRPFQTSAWTTRDYIPAFRAWGRAVGVHQGSPESISPDPNHHFSGPVILLTSAVTFSAAEDFAVAFDAMKRGLIVGEPTAGSTGQPLFFKLPGGFSARVCTKRDTYPDGRPFVGVGVQPQILVHPTIADLRAGRDTVLEAALAELRKTLQK